MNYEEDGFVEYLEHFRAYRLHFTMEAMVLLHYRAASQTTSFHVWVPSRRQSNTAYT